MTRPTRLAHCAPNGHRLALYVFHDGGYTGDQTYYVVAGPDSERPDEGDEYDTEAEARNAYEAEAKRLAKTPNWAAQAAYDEQWGTDNGYASFQTREY